MTRDELRHDLEEGTEAAATKAKIPPLTENEIDYLDDMFACPSRIWGVERGHEVVMTKDGCVNALNSSRMSSGVVAPVNREVGVRLFESMLGFDSMEVSHNDYSVKPQRFLKALEQLHMELLQETTIFPLLYGFMPNLGLYYRPDGSFPEPVRPAAAGQDRRGPQDPGRGSAGLPGRLHPDERLHARDGRRRYRLRHRRLHRRRRVPGRAEDHRACRRRDRPAGRDRHVVRDGARLPRSARIRRHSPGRPVAAPAAGALREGRHGHLRAGRQHQHRKSTPWNLSRAVTFVKACSEIAKIPIHANVGMGVGGVPMFETPAVDAVTRASAAMVEIGRCDGL